MTSQQYQMSLFEESEVSMLSVEDFRAKLSQLQESEKVSKILEELSSLRLQGSHLFSDPNIYSLRTSGDCLITKRGATFETILRALDELGYDVEWQVLNSKDYVPQNRERVFIIGHLRGECTRKIFPFSGNDEPLVELQRQQSSVNTITARYGEAAGVGSYVVESKQQKQVAIPVLTPDRLEKRQNGRRFKNDGDEMFTLTSQDRHGILVREATSKGYAEALPGDSVNISHPNSDTRRGRVGKGIANTLLTGEEQAVVTDNYRIRKLTPRECWRLQGFPDWAFDRAKEVNSDSQLYKQAGNSVTVPVIADIAKRL